MRGKSWYILTYLDSLYLYPHGSTFFWGIRGGEDRSARVMVGMFGGGLAAMGWTVPPLAR